MDDSAVNFNVTVDDFDSILAYPNQAAWTTPDPSSSSFSAAGSPWLMGTFHRTEEVNASVSLNFTGPAIFIYGYSGPDYGSYEVQLDNFTTTSSAYSSSNGTAPHLLYGAQNLTYDAHQLTLRNLGAQAQNGDAGGNALLFDFLRFTVQLAPAGATVSNATLEEDNSALKYSGTWGNNTSGNFSGGGSTFTQGDGASVSFSFNGSAIYVFGDKKNDHGLYSVVLDNGTTEVYNGVSGCGGEFGMTCEQQQPTLAYFASNLAEGEHSLTITNMAGVNKSFFDLDSIVLTVPSQYAPRQHDNSTSGSSGSGDSPTPDNSALSLSSVVYNPLMLLVFGVVFLLGPTMPFSFAKRR
ncbi:hypothetical protein K435DRAFT_763499 [Dendrothele bispora CBS 962.96]|uniref:Uncharacterized protein n=1 Tax=Dendrothele bispora (strain CBS 962.96) TaxID=1314807 RepID=A0A4S8LBX0_DENBC|nr:hypothetical protein K435DRAFT_763499 [Dendrothele bispora CBS 962.96]